MHTRNFLVGTNTHNVCVYLLPEEQNAELAKEERREEEKEHTESK